jgi:hypothetical protein
MADSFHNYVVPTQFQDWIFHAITGPKIPRQFSASIVQKLCTIATQGTHKLFPFLSTNNFNN